MIQRSMHMMRARRGQTIYQTMLAISCVMLALALFFPIFEYFTLYDGPPKTDMFSGETVSSPAPRARTGGEGAAEAPAPADTDASNEASPTSGGDEAEN